MEDQLWETWRQAAAGDAVDAELRGLYGRLDDEIATLGPTCWVSGKCCHFDSYGHRLYVTGLEIAWMLGQLGESCWEGVAKIEGVDGCPFQVEGKCGAHGVRPLGCRVYYCDPNAQGWQQDIYEKYLDEIRKMHRHHGIEYRYMEWRLGLSAGRAALG